MPVDVTEARRSIRLLAEKYFTKATVVYASQSYAVKQKKPLVKFSFGTISRPLNPPMEFIDGRPASFYPTTMQVQVDLFTQGKQRDIAPGVTPVMENTAAEDLTAFVNFLNSPWAISFCHQRDLAVVVMNNVQDLTDLINDTTYEFRAMVELELRFTTVALGYTGTLSPESVKRQTSQPQPGQPIGPGGEPSIPGEGPSAPTTPGQEPEYEDFDWQHEDTFGEDTRVVPVITETASGGGNQELAQDEEGYFENVAINERLVKEEKPT